MLFGDTLFHDKALLKTACGPPLDVGKDVTSVVLLACGILIRLSKMFSESLSHRHAVHDVAAPDAKGLPVALRLQLMTSDAARPGRGASGAASAEI